MTNHIIFELEKRLSELREEFNKELSNINVKVKKRYNTDEWNGMYSLPPDYAENYGKYVWGIRGKIISLNYVQGILDELKQTESEKENDMYESAFEYATKLRENVEFEDVGLGFISMIFREGYKQGQQSKKELK